MKGLLVPWGWAVLVRADADVAAVPGQRGTAGGRAGWEGAGQLVLKAVTLRGLPPEGSQHKLHHFWGLLQTWGRAYSSNFLWSHGV